MPLPNIFDKEITNQVIQRLNRLNADTQPQWGKMSVGQMLAHCSVVYELVYDDTIPKAKGFKKWLMQTFIKNVVVSEKPYKKNGRTAPEFLITTEKNFADEKEHLISLIGKTQNLGGKHFDKKESVSFGNLTEMEWNNMFYKHLNHHLTQFGV